MSFVIEKNVPLTGRQGRTPIYPLGLMEVGDSFSLGTTDQNFIAKARNSIANWGKANGKKFTVRKTDGGALRCWRLA